MYDDNNTWYSSVFIMTHTVDKDKLNGEYLINECIRNTKQTSHHISFICKYYHIIQLINIHYIIFILLILLILYLYNLSYNIPYFHHI